MRLSFGRIPGGGLILPPDTTTVVYRNLIVALAALRCAFHTGPP